MLDRSAFLRLHVAVVYRVCRAPPARPYGDLLETATPDPLTGRTVVTNLRLPGQYDERLLGSLGLQGPYYNWHRWYLPSIGRYLELDPVKLERASFTARVGDEIVRIGMVGVTTAPWYAYALNNPLRNVGPTGEWPGVEFNADACRMICTDIRKAIQDAQSRKGGCLVICELDFWNGTGDAVWPLGQPKKVTYCYCGGTCHGPRGESFWMGGGPPGLPYTDH